MSPVDHKAAVVGIANTATLNLLNDTLVGMWDLEQDKNDHAPQAESILFTNPGEESVIGEDERQRVPPSDFAPGGKYRCKSTHLSLENLDCNNIIQLS